MATAEQIAQSTKHQTVNEFLRRALGELGIVQLNMLIEIFKQDGVTQYELGERLNYKQGTVSKNARRFALVEVTDHKTGEVRKEGMNVITLRPDPVEYRRLACHLTDYGKSLRNTYFSLIA